MAVTKRYNAPRFWPIAVKAKKYVVTPIPGPHSKRNCMPLSLILRNVLGYAKTMEEAKQILNSSLVKINGTVRKEKGFPVGLMDVVEVDGEFHRVMPSKYGLQLRATTKEDGAVRLAKIVNKVQLGKKKMQLSLHDGTNMLVEKDDHKTSDVLVIEGGKVKHAVKFEKGAIAVVTDGNNSGITGKIHSIDKKLRTASITAGEKNVIVPIRYVFVVGHEKSMINIGEER